MKRLTVLVKFCSLFIALILSSKNVDAATINSTLAGGRWDDPATWDGGVIPSSIDDVVIIGGSTVVVRSPYGPANPAMCNSLNIEGTLVMGAASGSSRKLVVTNSITIGINGTVKSDELATHTLEIGGDFIVNGTFLPTGSSGLIDVVFNGASDQILDASTSSVLFNNVTVSKSSGQLKTSAGVTTLNIQTLSITSGEFLSPEMIILAGDFNNNSSGVGFNATTGTLVFNGTNQTIGGATVTTFNKVTCQNNTVLSNTRGITINGDLSIVGNAIFNVGGFDLTVNGQTNIGEASANGELTYASVTGTKTFGGKIVVSSNGKWDNTIGENIFLKGGLENNGTFISGSGTYFFNTNSQSISGTLVIPRIDAGAGITLTNNGNLTVSTILNGLGSFTQGNNATLELGGTLPVATFDASATGNTVSYVGGVQVVKGSNYANLNLTGADVSHIKTFSNSMEIISGNLNFSGTTSASTVRSLLINGNLSIKDNSGFIINDPITIKGTTSVGQNSSLSITSIAGVKSFEGRVSNEGSWSNTINENVSLHGGLTNQGNFLAGTGVYSFETNNQTFEGSISISFVSINSGVSLTNKGELTVASALSGLGNLIQDDNATLNIGGSLAIPGLTTAGINNSVNYTGGNQIIKGVNYVNLSLSGSGTKTLEPGISLISGDLNLKGSAYAETVNDLSVVGSFLIQDNASFINKNIVTIAGILSGTGSFTQAENSILNINGSSSLSSINAQASNNSVSYNGSSPQIASGSYYSVVIAPASGSSTLNGNVEIANSLNLQAGLLLLDNHNLIIGELGTLSIPSPSSASMIVVSGQGQLIKRVTQPGSYLFPVGDNFGSIEYSPVTLEITSASAFVSASLAVSVSDVKHPDNGSTNDYLSRYWQITQTGISDCKVNLIATYLNDDITGSEASIVAGALSGIFDRVSNGWKKYSAISTNAISVTTIDLSNTPQVFTGIGNSTPQVTITGGDGPAVCAGSSVQLDAMVAGDGPFAYVWTPTQGVSSINIVNPMVTPELTTEYMLTVYDVNGFSVSDKTLVQVELKPDVILPGNQIICSNASTSNLEFTSSISGTAFSWTNSNTGIGLAANGSGNIASFQAANSGGNQSIATITVLPELSVNNKICYGDSKSLTITVNPLPDVDQVQSIELCTGASVSEILFKGSLPNTEFNWSATDISIGLQATSGNSKIETFSLTNSGQTPVSSTITVVPSQTIAGKTCVGSSIQFLITANPKPNIVVNNLSLCVGASGVLTASGGTTYSWSPATGLTANVGTQVTASPQTTTTYTIEGVNAYLCKNTTQSIVTVNSIPTKPVITGAELLTPNPKLTSSSLIGNQWFKNGAILNGATNPQLTVTTDGAYTVQVTNAGCTGPLSEPFSVIILAATENIFSGPGLVYPNPAESEISIGNERFSQDSDISVTIYDLTGRLVGNHVIQWNNNVIKVNNLSTGLYLISARQRNVIVTQRFEKK